jgi:hypothetical protein
MRLVAALALLFPLAVGCSRDDPDEAPAAPAAPPPKPAIERPSAATFRVEGGEGLSRKPVVVIVGHGGQELGLHGGPPAFTLFDDRHVITKRDGKLVEGALSLASYGALLDEVRSSGVQDLPALFTGGVLSFHSLDTSILVADGPRYKRVRVVGFHDGVREKVPASMKRDPPPSAFLKVYRTLMDLPLPNAKPWEPRHVLAILRRASTAPQPWPDSIPEPGPERFRRAGDDSLLYIVVDRALAVSAWGQGGIRPWSNPKRGPYTWNGAAYELSHLGDTIEARAHLLRVDLCAVPDAARDTACTPPR